MEVLSMPLAGPSAAPAGFGSLYSSLTELDASASEGPAVSKAAGDSLASCDGSTSEARDQQQQQQAAGEQQAAAQQQAQQQQQQQGGEPEVRTHHLLKHCLSQSQRGEALQHFNTADPREAAKEIARMGQRELQAKFRDVYGNATKSNNNSWLRRKLYEAVGVAPLKASTKGKARKGGASGHRKSGGSRDGSKARAPKPAAPALKVAAAKREPQPAPAAPHLASSRTQGPSLAVLGAAMGTGMSILDLHQHSGLLSADTSDSEDGGSSSHGNRPASLGSSPDSPRSAAADGLAPFASGPMLGASGQQHAAAGAPSGPAGLRLPSCPAGFVPLNSSLPPEPQSPLAAGLHWADGLGSAAQHAQQQGGFFSAGGAGLGPLDADPLGSLVPASTFKPMDLEQDAAQLWEGGMGGCSHQPWYFGSGAADLGGFGASQGAGAGMGGGLAASLALPVAMDSSGAAATGCCGVDDDEIPLLTLDLGAIDVSI